MTTSNFSCTSTDFYIENALTEKNTKININYIKNLFVIFILSWNIFFLSCPLFLPLCLSVFLSRFLFVCLSICRVFFCRCSMDSLPFFSHINKITISYFTQGYNPDFTSRASWFLEKKSLPHGWRFNGANIRMNPLYSESHSSYFLFGLEQANFVPQI